MIWERLDEDNSRWWFLSQPEATFDYLAGESFAAIAEARRAVLAWNFAPSAVRGDQPHGSLRDTIKRILAATDSDAFQFDGIANVAPTYRVRPATEHWNWEDPGTDALPDQLSPTRRLRQIPGGAA
jgi:hypothetical protein